MERKKIEINDHYCKVIDSVDVCSFLPSTNLIVESGEKKVDYITRSFHSK